MSELTSGPTQTGEKPPRRNSIHVRLERIRTLLATQPMTLREIADAVHVSPRTMFAYRDLLAGEIRIAAWRRGTGGSPSPVYALGSSRDARRIEPIPKSTHSKAWRERVKRQDPAGYVDMLAKARARHVRNRPAAPKRDPIVEAMYGRAA